jgi:CDGSH-type Zn-finger protein
LPGVFDVKRMRWIDVNADSVDNIVDLIKKCPSGALSYELPAQAEVPPVEEKEPEVVITVATNSALRIAGKVRIVDLEGNLIMETEKCSLCRCGLSEKKPFCDGSHKRAGWQGEAWSQPNPS